MTCLVLFFLPSFFFFYHIPTSVLSYIPEPLFFFTVWLFRTIYVLGGAGGFSNEWGLSATWRQVHLNKKLLLLTVYLWCQLIVDIIKNLVFQLLDQTIAQSPLRGAENCGGALSQVNAWVESEQVRKSVRHFLFCLGLIILSPVSSLGLCPQDGSQISSCTAFNGFFFEALPFLSLRILLRDVKQAGLARNRYITTLIRLRAIMGKSKK